MEKEMKKILLYENRKSDPVAFDASTPELENTAFLKLFKLLDEDWQVYECGDMTAIHNQWYHLAKNRGDAEAAKKLLKARRNYEYETWQMVNVE
jgi:predicted ABC-class ATPase